MRDQRKDWGRFELLLEQYLKKHNITHSRLLKAADLQYPQLKSYCNNEIQRADLNVLARICYALECNIEDILRYVPPKDS